MSTTKIIDEIEKDRIFYEESSGGVTFSGGEPLMQPKFLETLLEECKERDIHATLDTCGYAPCEIIDRISDKVDLFLYDVKFINDRKHFRFTGASNKQILENLRTLAERGSNIIISFPLIPGINDDTKNVVETAKFVSSLHTVRQMTLLPYHRAGIQKYENLGKTYGLNEVQPPSELKLKSVKNTLEAFGLKVGIGGG